MIQTPYVFYIPQPGRLVQYLKARLYRPRIESGTVRQVLSYYGLELTKSPRNLPLGWRSRNVIIYTTAGKKVLKLYKKKWPVSTILHEHSIIRRLAQLNFPAPRLMTTSDDESLVSYDGQHFALSNFVDGTNFVSSFLLPYHRQKLITVAGKMLAQFHRQLAGFLPEGQHHLGYRSYSEDRGRDLAWHIDKLNSLPEKSRSLTHPEDKIHANWLVENRVYIQERLCQLDETLKEIPLSRLVIHGDYGFNNLHFHQDGTASLLDFELARLEWRLIDLIIVVSRLKVENSQVFMAAYQSEYPLSSEEQHFWPQVWEHYKLQSAVQLWNTYFETGASSRLAAAHTRLNQANWAAMPQAKLLKLGVKAGS